MFEQRIGGLVLTVCGVLTAILADGDITAAVVLVPLGCWLLFSRKNLFFRNQ